MSAPVLPTSINTDSEEYKARSAHNQALRDDLWTKVAEAAVAAAVVV